MECKCEFCKNKLPFQLPNEIIEETIKGNLVVFAGAGISTETRQIFKQTLYEEVAEELNDKKHAGLDFPNLMSQFCKQKNGRKLLLEKIRTRFDYCHQYKELYNSATRFHEEISSNHYLNTIVTTNWDDYFERECNAIPIVTPEDFAFYNIPGRKVFKIHGSISNYGSIIATDEDYKKCYKNLQKGLVGGYLKTLLATKTLLFVGFSFRDYDFNKIYQYLKKEMGEVIPHLYVVTLEQPTKLFDQQKMTLIQTDGTYFFSILRKHLEGSYKLIPKANLDKVFEEQYLCRIAHKRSSDYFYENRTVSAVYNLFYQDGLKHAYDYLIYHANSGETFSYHKALRFIENYKKMQKEMLKYKNYPDYAYVEGYLLGLHTIILGKEKKGMPLYYIFGLGPISTEKQFKKFLKGNKVYHKQAEKLGQKYFETFLDKSADIVPHHRPFIGD